MENIEIKFRVPGRLPGRVSHNPALKNNLQDRGHIKLLPFCLPAILIITLGVYYYSFPAPYFRPPLDLSTTVAGTFGEVRRDHFHLGIDIRTAGRENLPVYAMADGFVYRVSLQQEGYGKAMYIAYSNGLMSVYGHLNTFMPEIETALLEQQLLSEQWDLEMFFAAGRFPVKKGMVVAYSGNTGSSSGPHLHVEIRNMATKSIINPALAGISISDHQPPVIKSVFLYSATKSFYEVKGQEAYRTSSGNRRAYDKITEVSDSLIRIGVEAIDQNDDPKFKLGIYQARLFMDDILQYEFKMDSIPVAKERYVNATIDYAQWIRQKRCIQLLSVLPGNHLTGNQPLPGKGILHLTDGRIHRVKVMVYDASGNSKKVEFAIRYKPALKRDSKSVPELLYPGIRHKVSSRTAAVYFSPQAFYDAVPLLLKESMAKTAGGVSNTLTVHDPEVPVHTRYRVQLKSSLPENDPRRNKVLMELTSGENKIYVKGDWIGDHMDGTFDRFGKIRLIEDKIAPAISINERNKNDFSYGEVLKLRASDNCGLVESFTPRIDGKWVPFDRKNDLFFYKLNERLSKGKHLLQVEVRDKAGNRKMKTIEFNIK